jgi:hypothetical protein
MRLKMPRAVRHRTDTGAVVSLAFACLRGVPAAGRQQGGGRKSGRSVSVGRAHIQTSQPGSFVLSSACREAHESPNGPGPHCGGNHRRGRRILRCASRYGAVTGRRWRANHYGGSVPAGVIDPALPLTGRGRRWGNARKVLATDLTSQIGKLCSPGKLLQNRAQKQQRQT